ncbi:MAG: cellulase family glycosylhydrolase [Bacteroidetes bacterium]|nr:cellulase family glycosylhydrolase [Bacteroidota bacterium]
MKKILLSLLTIVSISLQAQTSNFIHTSGKYILDPCNDTLTIKGINYAPYNWGYTLSDLKIDQIAQTGANAVRMVWYWSNPGANVYYNYVALDSAISKCIQHKMIAIVELHDFTCGNSPSSLTNGSGWWTNNSVFPILQKYKQSVIVNIANEALQVNWSSNPTTALATYKSTYQNIITNLRNVTGFDFPLMIDAPDCGQHSDAFITSNTAADLITFDPKHNIIFSAHAYWYGYANNDSLQMVTKINTITAQSIPFVLGEIANQQDDASMCQYNLNYQPLLNYCESKKISWLAWSWDHDGCPARQISSTGNYSDLTSYGNDIINNTTYGLLSHPSSKSSYLVNNKTCNLSTGINNSHQELSISLFPNPSNGLFNIKTVNTIKSIKAQDIIGNHINIEPITESTFKITQNSGVYFITIIDIYNHSKTIKLILN